MDSDNSALFASTISTTDGAYTFFSASNVSSYGNANFGATGVYSYMYQFMSEVRDNEPLGPHTLLLEARCFIYMVTRNLSSQLMEIALLKRPTIIGMRVILYLGAQCCR